MNKLKVAIVGANGFIGRHLVEILHQKNNSDIFLFGRSDKSFFGEKLPYTQIDLTDTEKITQQFSGIDLIYYLASESIPASTWENPKTDVEKNLLPFIHFMECAAKVGVKKIVFVSSAGTIYGATKDKVHESSEKKPFSPYGIVKLTMEYFLNYFEAKYSLHYDVFRVSNVYGFGQDTSKGLGIINTFIEKIIKENKISIFGNGENIRNYVYVGDVAKLLSLSTETDLAQSNIYNLSSNDTISINQLVAVLKSIVEEKFQVNYQETRQSDNSAIYLDNSKLLKTFPNFKFSSIEEGIKNTYQKIKSATHSHI